MTLYAVDNLDDALDATRELLLPVDRWQWLKLAVIVLFMGVSGTHVAQFSFGGSSSGSTASGAATEAIEPVVWLAIIGVLATIFVFAVLYAVIGSVMEFVFVDALRNESVRIRAYWRDRWSQGLRLFGFRLGVFLFTVTAIGLFATPAVAVAAGAGDLGAGALAAVYLVLAPVFVVLAVGIGVTYVFTTVFVVPVMILEDCGVVAGWRRLWPSLRAAWKQYLTYAVAGLVLTVVGGTIFTMLAFVAAVLLLVPFGVVGALGAGILLIWEPVGWVVIAFVVLAYVLTLLVVASVIQVPIQVYLRYFALLVLGDIESDFDVIPEQRARIRDGAKPE